MTAVATNLSSSSFSSAANLPPFPIVFPVLFLLATNLHDPPPEATTSSSPNSSLPSHPILLPPPSSPHPSSPSQAPSNLFPTHPSNSPLPSPPSSSPPPSPLQNEWNSPLEMANGSSRNGSSPADDEEDILSILLALEEDSVGGSEGGGEMNETDGTGGQNQTMAPSLTSENGTIMSLDQSNGTWRMPTTIDAIAQQSTTSIPEIEEQHFSRLPDALWPLQYSLRLTLDSELDIVQGQVQVEFQCYRPTSLIRLHLASDFVQLGHALLEESGPLPGLSPLPTLLPFRSISLDWRRQQLSLRMVVPLKAGHLYQLAIWFSAHYANDGRGLTRRKDRERGIWMNTLFEPSFARRLFPCWDEPRFRSAFRLELWLHNRLAQDDYVALSATDGQCQRWNANLRICHFEATPPIPTYLFSLAIGRFRSVCAQSALVEMQSRICLWRLAEGRKKGEAGEEEEAEEWDERGRQVIQAMAQFQTGMADYLLADTGARLHLLIVPMKINGMENFGLLNVRESLWPPANDTSGQLVQRFEKTLFHEMTHQWFGNLVTMEWWDSIWLAESLTNFLATSRPIVFDPSTDLSEHAIVDAKWAEQSVEGVVSAIPGIVYTKGAALMETLDAIIGATNMQKLLRQFIRLYRFKSAKTADFLDLLQKIITAADGAGNSTKPSSAPVPSDHHSSMAAAVHFLHRWLHLPSHPIVFVDFDPQVGQLCFSQTPKMPLLVREEARQQRWPIPIWVECLEGTKGGGEQLLWIPDTGSAQLVVPLNQLTATNSTRSLAFNRNRPVYYQLTIRNLHNTKMPI